jgi:aminoglycoside phosphotransferase (APT) family kinase protein
VRPGLLARPYRAALVVGGKSNLTYLVTDRAGREVVVRRPPVEHVLATAHDMSREYRVVEALAGSAVPVPEVQVLCTDPDVVGAPFYVMSKVDGVAYRHREQLEHLGAARVGEICAAMIDTLVNLHRVDVDSVGLADLGRPQGYLRRQVERWQRQLAQSRSREVPGLADLYRRLATDVPAESRAALVHGDYRLDNLLVVADEGGVRVTAVLDWELATLGDPLMDLAMLVAHSHEGTQSPFRRDGAPTAAGFVPADELRRRYERMSGVRAGNFSFYLALAFFKMVGIVEGIHFRSLTATTAAIRYEDAGARVPWLVQAGLDALNR